MRSLSQELLHQAGRAAAIYMLVALLAVSAAVTQALIFSPQPTEQADPESGERRTSSAPSATGGRWINPS